MQMNKIIFLLIFIQLILPRFSILAQNEIDKSPNDAESFQRRLLPAPIDGGFKMEGYWIWGASVIKGDDGRYYMFASRWPHKLKFGPHWLTNSEIVLAVSDKPEGPYKFQKVILPPRREKYWDGKMTHNPDIKKYGDTYLLYYTGTTYTGKMPDPDHQALDTSALVTYAHYHERIGLATSKSIFGPWKRFDKPILDVRKGKWDSLIVSNASPVILPDGKIMLFYKGVSKLRHHAISAAIADNYMGPYKRISDEPFDMGVDAEDPTIWYENGKYHALMLDTGKKYSNKEIYYCTSDNLLKWKVDSNPIVIKKNILWDDGKYRKMNSTERPKIFLENDKATNVFIATGSTINGVRYTWNMVIPLRTN
jgi:predicted GH43/DUF377 family glycosyl hydrolase